MLFSHACKKLYVNPLIIKRQIAGCKSPVEDKVALITGGSMGIGFSYAKVLLDNGAKGVAIGDIKTEEGIDAICELANLYGKEKVILMKTDVTKKNQLKGLFKATLNHFKQLDIVVNNAGMLNDTKWEKEIKTNINPVVQGTLFGFEFMGKNKNGCGGHIINVSSVLGLARFPGSPIYVGTKHFIVGFSRSMGHSIIYEKTGVKVMTVCPGITETSMLCDVEKKALEGFDCIGQLIADRIEHSIKISPDMVGCALLNMLMDDVNGSVWVVEEDQVYKVKIPPRKLMRC